MIKNLNNIMKRCRRTIWLTALIVILIISLSSCSQKYDDKWILGKTSSEIEEKYGTFDYIYSDPDQIDGNYYNGGCAYLTKEEKVGYLGTDPAEYYMIYFDSEGKAYEIVKKWYVPGG